MVKFNIPGNNIIYYAKYFLVETQLDLLVIKTNLNSVSVSMKIEIPPDHISMATPRKATRKVETAAAAMVVGFLPTQAHFHQLPCTVQHIAQVAYTGAHSQRQVLSLTSLLKSFHYN